MGMCIFKRLSLEEKLISRVWTGIPDVTGMRLFAHRSLIESLESWGFYRGTKWTEYFSQYITHAITIY